MGGSALNLLGYIDRQTRDVDIIKPELFDTKQASIDFAKTLPYLQDDWLNNGPALLDDILPVDWELSPTDGL